MGLLNFADLARDEAMPQTTVHRYWTMFEATFLLRTIPPWHANLVQNQMSGFASGGHYMTRNGVVREMGG